MKKKSILLGLTALIVVAAMAIGGTLAYFTGTDSAKNTFTVGSVSIVLYEHSAGSNTDINGLKTWSPGTSEVKANTYSGIYPGAVLPKDPTIRNTGNNPAYVQMKITISHAAAWAASITAGTNLTAYVGGFDPALWRRSNIISDTVNDTLTYVYEYKSILPVGGNTGALFTSITIPSSLNNAQMTAVGGVGGTFTLDITAEAIQAEGFGSAAAAFAELNA